VYRQFGTTQTTQQRLCKLGDDPSKCVNPASVCPADDTSPFCNSWNTYKCTSTQSDECDTLFKSYKPPPLPVPKETAKKVDDETCQGEECPFSTVLSENEPNALLANESKVQPQKESKTLQNVQSEKVSKTLQKESKTLQNVQSKKESSSEETTIMQPSSNLKRLDSRDVAFLKEFARFLQFVRNQTKEPIKSETDQPRVIMDQTGVTADQTGFKLVTTDHSDVTANQTGSELIATDQTKPLDTFKTGNRLMRLCKDKKIGCIYHVRDIGNPIIQYLLNSLQKLGMNNFVGATNNTLNTEPNFTFAQLADLVDYHLKFVAGEGKSVDPLFQNLASKTAVDYYNETRPKKEKEQNEAMLKAKNQYIIEQGVKVWGEINVDNLSHMTLDEKIDLLNTLNKRPLKDVMFRLRGYKNSENLFAFEMVDCGHYRAVEALLTGKSFEEIITLIEMPVADIFCKINWWFSTTRYTTVKQQLSKNKYRGMTGSMASLPTPDVVQIDSFDNILEKIAKLYNKYDRETAEPDKSNWKMYYFLLDKNDWKFGTISSKPPLPEVLQYNDLPRFQGNTLEKKQTVAVQVS